MRKGIVDFHAHPFLYPENNCCNYKVGYAVDAASARARLEGLGITRVRGSVLGRVSGWVDIVRLNNLALEQREQWSEFYKPGFHIHPGHVQESIVQIERMALRGVRLLGEVVPICTAGTSPIRDLSLCWRRRRKRAWCSASIPTMSRMRNWNHC